jgi:hypothetical protein
MAISNYTELKTAVQSWLHRPDVDCADFVRMGEAFLNRRLELSPMLQTSTSTLDADTEMVALPSRCVRVLGVKLSGNSLTPARVSYMDSQPTGKPDFYEATDAIYFERPLDVSYVSEVFYLKGWALETDTTNWLIATAPDAYLYASLVAATPFVIDERLATFKPLLDEVVGDLNKRYPAIGRNARILNTEVSGMIYAT